MAASLNPENRFAPDLPLQIQTWLPTGKLSVTIIRRENTCSSEHFRYSAFVNRGGGYDFQAAALGEHAENPGGGHIARADGSASDAFSWVSLPSAPEGSPGKTRPRVSGAPKDHLRPWLFLAPAQELRRREASQVPPEILGLQVAAKRGTGPPVSEAAEACGMVRHDGLGLSNQGPADPSAQNCPVS